MIKLQPERDAYDEGHLEVSDIHSIYYSQAGNPQGQPILLLHGGPGAKSKPKHRAAYDTDKFRIIQFDQRGCGKSTPAGEITENTTQNLVADIETLRKHLQLDKWIVSGGSWGSTLALVYAETHPDSVEALMLNGIFLARKKDIDWLNLGPVRRIFPELARPVEQFWIEQRQEDDIYAQTFYRLLTGADESLQRKAAMHLSNWEGNLLKIDHVPQLIEVEDVDEELVNSMKIFMHYEVHQCFLNENQLLDNASKLQNIPVKIIHGRYDIICTADQAYELHKAVPHSELYIAPLAGHHGNESQIQRKLIEWVDTI